MKQIVISKNTVLSFGAWDGVCNKSKTQENNALYTEVWIGKVEYKYPKNLICTMYVFLFFRILRFKEIYQKEKNEKNSFNASL